MILELTGETMTNYEDHRVVSSSFSLSSTAKGFSEVFQLRGFPDQRNFVFRLTNQSSLFLAKYTDTHPHREQAGSQYGWVGGPMLQTSYLQRYDL